MSEFEDEDAGSIGLAAVTRHKVIVLLFTLIGVGVGLAYYATREPVYASAAKIMVTQADKPLEVDGQIETENTRNSVFNLVERLRGRDFLERVVARHDLQKLPAFEAQGLDPYGTMMAILDELYVQPKLDTDVIEMSYQGPSPIHVEKVLSAIVTDFEEELTNDGLDASSQMVTKIEEARDVLRDDLRTAEEEYRLFREQSGLTTLGDGTANMHAERLATIEAKRQELVLQRTNTQAKLDGISRALASGSSREAVLLLIEQESRNSDGTGGVGGLAATVGNELLPLILEKEELRIDGKGKDHPAMKAVERKIEVMRSHLQEIAGGQGGPVPDLVDVYRDALRQQMRTIETEIESVDRLFADEQEMAQGLVKNQFREQELRGHIEDAKRAYSAVIDNLSEASLTSRISDTEFRVINRPHMGVQIPLHRERSLAIGGMTGLLLGGLLGFFLEASDRRFQSPKQIQAVAGAPVIGHIPKFRTTLGMKTSAPFGVAPAVVTAKRPQGPVAEAYRYVRTVLTSSLEEGQNVIQVTSPKQSDGKSTLAANLATAFAANGKRVVLVDCDLRRPAVRKLFPGCKGKKGLTSVLSKKGRQSLESVTCQSNVPRLSIIPSGHRPANPSEALSGMTFRSVVSELREQYDLVVLDTPPIMAVADPAIVAESADAVILAMTLTKYSRSQLEFCRDTLGYAGANLAGVVVNKVKSTGGDRYQYGQSAGYYEKDKRGYYSYTSKRGEKVELLEVE